MSNIRTALICTFFQTLALALQLPIANFSRFLCLQKIVVRLLQHKTSYVVITDNNFTYL